MISTVVTPPAISACSRGRDCVDQFVAAIAARVALTVERMPPPARGDLLIARAVQPLLELAGAVAGEDEMGVAIDQARRDPGAVQRLDLRAR